MMNMKSKRHKKVCHKKKTQISRLQKKFRGSSNREKNKLFKKK